MNITITDNKENKTIVVQHEDEIIDRYPYEEMDNNIIFVDYRDKEIVISKDSFIYLLELEYKDKT